jgi:cell division protein FtsL
MLESTKRRWDQDPLDGDTAGDAADLSSDLDLDDDLDDDARPLPKPAPRRVWTSVVAALLATSAVVGLLLVHVWSRYRVLDLGYQVSNLSRERESLLEEQRRLQIEMQVLTRAERLEPAARRQMALVTPSPQQILYVPSSRLPLPPLPMMTPKASSLPALSDARPLATSTGMMASTGDAAVRHTTL